MTPMMNIHLQAMQFERKNTRDDFFIPNQHLHIKKKNVKRIALLDRLVQISRSPSTN